MTDTPLRDGLERLLGAVRNEEWTLARVLTDEERERAGTDGAPEVKELLMKAAAGRKHATLMLREVLAGRSADGCEEPAVEPAATWDQAHRTSHDAIAELLAELANVSEEQLAVNPGPLRNHPQYLWRDVAIQAVRGPMNSYAEWHHRNGREFESVAVLSRWYQAAHCAGLPTKALSDASYDLACGLSRAGRPDRAMQFLPDAFAYNDRAAVPVLKAWARQDRDLAPLGGRADFHALVG
jgi:hypothetical protein